jgi:hypothetical protein
MNNYELHPDRNFNAKYSSHFSLQGKVYRNISRLLNLLSYHCLFNHGTQTSDNRRMLLYCYSDKLIRSFQTVRHLLFDTKSITTSEGS